MSQGEGWGHDKTRHDNNTKTKFREKKRKQNEQEWSKNIQKKDGPRFSPPTFAHSLYFLSLLTTLFYTCPKPVFILSDWLEKLLNISFFRFRLCTIFSFIPLFFWWKFLVSSLLLVVGGQSVL